MSYLSQIPIEDVREWLKLNDNSNDNVISLMLSNACKMFENKTNHLIYQRSFDYKKCDRIYDFPISDVTNLTKKANYYIADEDVTLTIGYASGEFPDEMKELILSMVEYKFYNNEDEGNLPYPQYLKDGIQNFKRFYL